MEKEIFLKSYSTTLKHYVYYPVYVTAVNKTYTDIPIFGDSTPCC